MTPKEKDVFPKRKFKVSQNKPAKTIPEMNLDELLRLKKWATLKSNVAGYNDEGGWQNYWIGVEACCSVRINRILDESHL